MTSARKSRTVTGCMNTFANIGGALSPLVVAYSLDWWHSWVIPLLIGAADPLQEAY